MLQHTGCSAFSFNFVVVCFRKTFEFFWERTQKSPLLTQADFPGEYTGLTFFNFFFYICSFSSSDCVSSGSCLSSFFLSYWLCFTNVFYVLGSLLPSPFFFISSSFKFLFSFVSFSQLLLFLYFYI